MSIMRGIRVCLIFIIAAVLFDVSAQKTECENDLVGDIVFLVDSSGSIGSENFDLIKEFLKSIIKGLDIGPQKIRVGLAQYSRKFHPEFGLKDNEDKESLLNKVNQMYYRKGKTWTGEALDSIRTRYFTELEGSRAGERVPQIAVLITDGGSSDNVEEPAWRLRNHGVLVFCIGVEMKNQTKLETIASPPHHHNILPIKRFQDLQSQFGDLLKSMCVYMENQKKVLTNRYVDIFYLVDSGLSLGEFIQLRERLSEMISRTDVGLSSCRLGLAQFGQDIEVEFLLNKHETKSETLEAVQKFSLQSPPNQRRNLSRALEYAKTHFFGAEAGGRAHLGVPQLLVIVLENEPYSVTTLYHDESAFVCARALKLFGISVSIMSNMEFPGSINGLASSGMVFPSLSLADLHQKVSSSKGVVSRQSEECEGAGAADVVFILSDSGGSGEDDFPFLLVFLDFIINSLEIGQAKVRVGIVTASHVPRVEAHLNTFHGKAELEHFISLLPPRQGGAKIGAALNSTREVMFRERNRGRRNARKVAIVITDTKSQDSVSEAASSLRRAGTTVYAVGVKDAERTELEEMASHPSSRHVFPRADFSSLVAETQTLLRSLCSGIAESLKTAGESSKDAEKVCVDTDQADIFFLIEDSGGISQLDFSDTQKFVISFLPFFHIGPRHVRIGLVKYSDSPSLEFDLTEKSDPDAVEKAVLGIRREGGGAYTGRALSFMNAHLERDTASRRVPRFLIVVTGGEATDEVKGPAEALRQKDVTLLAVGVKNANETQLMEISGDSRRTFYVNHFDALESISDGVLAEICAPAACQQVPVDVFFLTSGFAGSSKRDFQKMKDLLKSVISMFTLGPDDVRVGVMQLGGNRGLEFGLNKYFSSEEMLGAVDRMQPVEGGNRLGRSLTEVSKYLEAAGGGRPGLKQSLVVITDLWSIDEVRGPASALRAREVEIYAVGVLEASRKQLLEISGSSDKVFHLEDFDGLPALGGPLALKLCGKDCRQTDLVFLLDHSTSISADNHKRVLNFTADVVRDLTVGKNLLHVGLAQFSDALRHGFYLSEHLDKEDVVSRILNSPYVGGDTYLGKALRSIKDYFLPRRGGRRGTPQTLVLITDGDSRDDVEEAAEGLRDAGIEILAIGVGDVYDVRLLQIVKDPKNLFSIWNFGFLSNNKKKVVDAICKKPPSQPEGCSVDVFIGVDVSSSGKALRTFIPGLEEIVQRIPTVEDLCCSAPVHTNISFYEVEAGGGLRYNTNFEEVLNRRWSKPSFLNSALLNLFKKTFREKSRAKIKVLLIFSDGLDEDVVELEQTSEELQKSGVSVLLTVALRGADPAQLQMVEFGRGLQYRVPLSISLPGVSSSILQQISGAAHRLCCGVMCKCWGPEGIRGPSGAPGMKGSSGRSGWPGFPGEEGVSGERGPPGQSGPTGPQGCPGSRGQKGSLGLSGTRGEEGLGGLDGVHGEQGDAGPDGIGGRAGHPGSPGVPGIDGERGSEGQRGLCGDPGDPGANSAIRGPRGESGPPGNPGQPGVDGGGGAMGSPGNKGSDGRRGPPGELGPAGGGGAPGGTGPPGTSGPQGPRGGGGDRGPKGVSGFPGVQGALGPAGEPGQAGRRGRNGQKGHPGEPGLQGAAGPQGPRGAPGRSGAVGFGPAGPAGAKGQRGFPGHPGLQGDGGSRGTKGNPGPAGGPGGRGRSGLPGAAGESGDPGNPGHGGAKGPPGAPDWTECELTAFIRDHCACSRGNPASPALPTELVFALDFSGDVSSSSFELQRSALFYLLEGVTVAHGNCPAGARVSVVGFHEWTTRLIRFHEHSHQRQLAAALKDIPWKRTPFRRHLGAAMRFVGQSVFKRVRAGLQVRKVAVFFSGGQTQDVHEVAGALMELRALNIVPVVVSLTDTPQIARALELDDSGTSIFTVLARQQDLPSALRKVRNCAISFDPCRRSEDCAFIQDPPPPQQMAVDLAVVVDGSREVQADEFAGAQQLLGSVLEQLAVSAEPSQARVAVVQQGSAQAPKLEFGLQTFQNRDLMKRHLLQNMQQQGGPSLLGRTLEYTLREVLPRADQTRRKRVLLTVLATRTAFEDRSALRSASQRAHCDGVALFVLTVGDRYNQTQVEELASSPVQQHLIHVDRLGAEGRSYAQRFFRVFLSALSKGTNQYPPLSLRAACSDLDGQGGVEKLDQSEVRGDGLVVVSGVRVNEPQGVLQPELTSFNLKDACLQPLDQGSCQEYAMMWFFSSTENKCAPFWYGGCSGNQNRFVTEEECQNTCVEGQ